MDIDFTAGFIVAFGDRQIKYNRKSVCGFWRLTAVRVVEPKAL